MKTTLAKAETTTHGWKIVDAKDQILGRLAVSIANALRGRDKPTYTPHVDTGDFVIVINAEKVKLTGSKEEQKNICSTAVTWVEKNIEMLLTFVRKDLSLSLLMQ